jgi:hypothetical protein
MQELQFADQRHELKGTAAVLIFCRAQESTGKRRKDGGHYSFAGDHFHPGTTGWPRRQGVLLYRLSYGSSARLDILPNGRHDDP